MAHQIVRQSLMERIEQNLDRIAHSLRGKRTDTAVNGRMELVLAKMETYIDCRRPPMTVEKAVRRAMAATRRDRG
jgi:hypothetical protein